jgi:RHS repeat-associated protein
MEYANSPIGYANPDAVTQIANGLSTTTYAYDNNGNLVSSGNGTATTTYTYDYANRLIALNAGGATTTYGYDAFGQRVIQTGTSTTTIYPFKWYSIASSTGTGAKYATTTSYTFNGDTLLATVDQQTASGVATGTAQTRFIHPDHLGSTNVVTDQNDNLVQTLDYYPYGATRVAVSAGANEARKYVNRFADQSGLDYLSARYYDAGRGQFVSEDPTFLALGNASQVQQLAQQDQKTFLYDPQQLNSYNYADDNPIVKKDPDGRRPECILALVGGTAAGVKVYMGDVLQNQAEGKTGLAAFTPRSSPQVYVTNIAFGAASAAVAPQSLLLTGALAFTGSAASDAAGGKRVDLGSGLIDAGVSMATAGFYSWGTGGSLLEDAMGAGLKRIPSSVLKQGVRYSIGQETFSNASSLIAQNAYANRQLLPTYQTWQTTLNTLPSVVQQNGITYTRNSSGLLNVAK